MLHCPKDVFITQEIIRNVGAVSGTGGKDQILEQNTLLALYWSGNHKGFGISVPGTRGRDQIYIFLRMLHCLGH
jgi:hypothetical protein